MKTLALANDLKLPADEAVAQKYAFIGRSGSGKTYGAMKLAELFLEAEAQVIAVDWVGNWWALRLAQNGKSPGFQDVYIFGGEHADAPLEATGGAMLADLLVDKHISAVLDLSPFRKGERTRFATAFAEQLFHRKKTARTACHLFLEEAQAFLPQMVRGDDARMVGVFEDIGKVGRNYGIGVSIDPRELKRRIAELEKAVVTAARQQNPKPEGIRQQDAKPLLTDADRELLARLATAIKGRSDDLRTIESDLVKKIEEAVTDALQRLHHYRDAHATEFSEVLERVGLQKILARLEGVATAAPGRGRPTATAPPARVTPHSALRTSASPQAVARGSGVGKSGLRRILIALAQRPGLNRRQLGLRACLSSRSGTFDTYLSKGRSSGWIEGSDRLTITDAGVDALGTYEPLPEGTALLQYWLGELGNSGAARILQALADVHPRALSRAALGEAANLSDRSGTFDTYLSRLRTLQLVEGRGELKASDELFDL